MSLFPIFLRMFLVIAATGALVPAGAEERLQIERLDDGFRFHVEGAGGDGPWVLQHSPDGRAWEELAFMGEGKGVGDVPSVDVPTGILSQPDAPLGLFRAVQLPEDNTLLRRMLDERAKWRLSGNDSYQYEMRQNSGPISWHGSITVTDGAVTEAETIEQWPPDFPTDIPTIEDLFRRVAHAIAVNAETIDVQWHPDYGFPGTCYIDYVAMIADEERGWKVEKFDP